jgi:hypothetical protein
MLLAHPAVPRGRIVPLLGFKARFADAVENGVAAATRRPLPHPGTRPKRQTIRACRSDGRDPRAGDMLHLYTGLRTRHVRKLGTVPCRRAVRIRIGVRAGITVDGVRLAPAAIRRLAQADGFRDAQSFHAVFESLHGLPFDGWLIGW